MANENACGRQGTAPAVKRIMVLKLNKEFKRAYYQGSYKAHPLVVSYRVKNRVREPRMGITTAKKIGCAVVRNRARRVIKQAVRELLAERPELFCGYDFVFVAREKTAEAKSGEIKQIILKQLTALSKGVNTRVEKMKKNSKEGL